MENVGVSEDEANLIEGVNNFVDRNINMEVGEKKGKKEDLRNYRHFVNYVNTFTI
jgi:hypothetical protein